MTTGNGSRAPSAEASTMEPNPDPPETPGASAGPSADPPADDQQPREQPRRRKRTSRSRAAAPAADKPADAPAPNDEQMADIGRLSVLAAKCGMTVEDYATDLRAMVGAYDAMQAYVAASKK